MPQQMIYQPDIAQSLAPKLTPSRNVSSSREEQVELLPISTKKRMRQGGSVEPVAAHQALILSQNTTSLPQVRKGRIASMIEEDQNVRGSS